MKKSNLEETHNQKCLSKRRLPTPFKRMLRIMKIDSEPLSNSAAPMKMAVNSFVSFEEIQKIRCHLLQVEKDKAEAIQQIQKHRSMV